jgi:hypothetical protein
VCNTASGLLSILGWWWRSEAQSDEGWNHGAGWRSTTVSVRRLIWIAFHFVEDIGKHLADLEGFGTLFQLLHNTIGLGNILATDSFEFGHDVSHRIAALHASGRSRQNVYCPLFLSASHPFAPIARVNV